MAIQQRKGNFFLLFQNLYYAQAFFKNFLLQLIYNVLSISAVQQSDPVLYTHTHTHILFLTLSIMFHHNYWTQFPVLQHRISLVIHSKWNSLHLLTPNSKSIPHPPLPWQPQLYSVLCVHEFFSFLQIGSFIATYLDSKFNCCHIIFVFL